MKVNEIKKRGIYAQKGPLSNQNPSLYKCLIQMYRYLAEFDNILQKFGTDYSLLQYSTVINVMPK